MVNRVNKNVLLEKKDSVALLHRVIVTQTNELPKMAIAGFLVESCEKVLRKDKLKGFQSLSSKVFQVV